MATSATKLQVTKISQLENEYQIISSSKPSWDGAMLSSKRCNTRNNTWCTTSQKIHILLLQQTVSPFLWMKYGGWLTKTSWKPLLQPTSEPHVRPRHGSVLVVKAQITARCPESKTWVIKTAWILIIPEFSGWQAGKKTNSIWTTPPTICVQLFFIWRQFFTTYAFFSKKKTISTVVQMFGNPFGGLYVYDVIWFIRYYRLGCIPVPQCREVWQLIWRTLDMLQMGKYTCFASPCSGRIACVHLVFALGSVHHCLTSMCHPYTSCGMMEYTQWSLFSYTSRSIQNVGWFHSLHLW